jgi:hypothetical protein
VSAVSAADREGAREADALGLLSAGDVEILGLLPRSSNYTFLTRVTAGDREALAVYKPSAGETPLWDFPEGTLCRREVAAYLVSRAIGWPPVPPTLLRDGPEGPGSLQLFVEFDPTQHYFTLQERRRSDFRRIAVFDAVVNNADRKAGHCLLARDGTIWVVDHGVCFNVEPKLRTVIWDFLGEEIPDELREAVGRLPEQIESAALGAELRGLLASDEVDAIVRRVGRLLRPGRFPEPGPGYPYPWPPV